MHCAVVYDSSDLLAMGPGILGRAPDAGDTKLAASATFIVVGAIHLSPSVGAAGFDSPALSLGMFESSFDFGVGVRAFWPLGSLQRYAMGHRLSSDNQAADWRIFSMLKNLGLPALILVLQR